MNVFAIGPPSSKPLWMIAIICVMLIAVLMVLAYTAYASRHSRVEIKRDRLELVGDFWGRDIPFSQLHTSGARLLDLTGNSPYVPKHRTLGTGLPGYTSGWFRLRNGEKALVYLTRRRDVVYVPTSDGYALLLSVENPERFIETLQRARH